MSLRTISICSILLTCLAGSASAQEGAMQLPDDANTRIPSGSRVFIGPIDGGYDIYLSAAMTKKAVPVIIVTQRDKADFELSGVTETDKAGWAKIVFMRSTSSNEQASVKMVNLKTGTVVWGYNVNKSSSARGKQSSSEACAKHLKEKIEKGS
jgi:hypothetical protein